ncbi:centrosome-associated protein Alms1a [Drosophila tropicalis]|uniref:centrosome-associated protein Alms1a n=1 Tax=Drosophila tropicalis TaxID=46794 RepID=UPI0035AC0EAB
MSHQHNRQQKQDMDEEPRSSTSRVPPKVREYISEMAVDRELERYMALSSTASSGGSGHSCALVMGAAGRPSSSLCPRNRCRSGSSRQSSRKSLSSCLLDVVEPPQSPPPGPSMLVEKPTSGSTDDVVLIPIVMENSQVVVSKKQISASVEDLRTPTKAANLPKEMQTKKTQTPESAVKSHKRLEWDPSADVGYYKRAVSTSNISTLERSVMEDCWRLPHQRSESDLNRLQMQDQKAEESQQQQQQQPPLASSTFVNRTISRNRESNASSRRDSQVTVGTSLYGSSVASSFDYQQPSLQQEASMTIATSSTTSTSVSATPSLTQRNSRQLEQERLFTAAQFQRVLSENKDNSSNNNNRKKKEKPRGERENKENLQPGGSHRSSVSGSGELDLGIDLLCSLIKTRSLSHGQKKHLVREIAKRISCLESGDSSSRSSRQGRHESLPKLTSSQPPPPSSDPAPATAQMKSQSTNTTRSITKIQCKATNTTSSITKMQTIAPVPAPRTHLPTTRSSGESSTSCSHDLITQKTNVQAQSANSTDADVDTEQVALQDWLNPMTQSEIEYEQRAKRGPDTERRHQLVWIESEIKRLQTLHTLLATATTKIKPNAVCPSPLHIESAGRSTVITEQIIHSVPLVQTPSSTDSRATGGAERPPPAEGNNNLGQKNQPKETQTDEMQIIPAAPPVTPANTPLPPPQIPQRGAPPCSTLSPPPRPPPPPPPPPPERHFNHELQLQQQRSKMATPASSSGGGRSESVCSFVQQRQRQFMEHYQNQQQQQLYLLQQHHQQQQQQQQQPNQFYYRHQHQPQCHHPHHHHHQQPHGAQVMLQEQQQRPLSPYLQMQYATYATPYLGENAHSCGDDGAIYYQVVNSQGAASYVQATAVATGPAAATATASTHCRTTTTSSASSMLCISSEISIPMGMVNTCETTTTTTTTHQYDDVACQRRRQQPQPRTQPQTQSNQMTIERMQQTHTQTMQVRPRGIAYVIQFTVNGDSEVLPETLSLQDQLQRARPEFCAKSKQRKAILNQMQMLRNVRRREMDELLGENINTNVETVDKQLQQLPPPAASRIRIFSTKEMKALTSKRCQSLPEVLAAKNRMREEQRRRNNRMMRDVFNRRLHNRVAKGQLSLNHSRTII